MATIQVRVDSNTKTAVDTLFSSLGLDTSTAVKMFLAASLENNGLPFPVKRRTVQSDTVQSDLQEAIDDTRLRRNLHGPFKTAEKAVAAMLEE